MSPAATYRRRSEGRSQVAEQFAAYLIWMSDDRLLPGRSYLLKIGTRTLPATVTELKHRLDVNTLDKHATKTLALNEVGFCNLATLAPIAFDAYADNRETGAFILIDRYSNATVAAGLISFTFGAQRIFMLNSLPLTRKSDQKSKIKNRRSFGLPGYPELASRRLLTWSMRTFMRAACTR